MKEEPIELTRALVKLSDRARCQIAASCGVSESNFSAFMRGVRPFPTVKQQSLMSTLGLDGNGLLKQKVHLWNVGQDIVPLQIAVSHLFPNGAQIEGIWRAGGGIWDVRRSFDNVLIAVTDGSARVIINRSGIGFVMALNPVPITPKTVHGFKWKSKNIGAEAMIQIEESRYQSWAKGEICNEEFDAAFNGKSDIVTWEQVKEFANQDGMTPNEVLSILMANKQITQ